MFAKPGYKQIDFPRTDSFTAVDRASGVAAATSVLTAAVDSMALDQCPTVSWIYDSQDVIQSSIDWQANALRRAASSVARYVDSKIIAVAEAEGEATATVSPLITQSVFLKLLKHLRHPPSARRREPRVKGALDVFGLASIIGSVELARNPLPAPERIGIIADKRLVRRSKGVDPIAAVLRDRPARGVADLQPIAVDVVRYHSHRVGLSNRAKGPQNLC